MVATKRNKGFTLIELMIVVIIIGLLSAMALPRFRQASQRSKKSEARLMLKNIYQAARIYYLEKGGYPPCNADGSARFGGWWMFNNASTQNRNWNKMPGLDVVGPSGYPRFTYIISRSGPRFRAEAWAWSPDSYDGAIVYGVRDLWITEDGIFIEGPQKPTW
ncbi:MAG TPA: prepilin-type N-terminal cleavage/methylation domain-containing protein [candidate division Zixibacteria bacterium]|nr:prepilin-type N-terminal cleavage/methylation domain-containing protein [candidate division Zixibacteria bacterium]